MIGIEWTFGAGDMCLGYRSTPHHTATPRILFPPPTTATTTAMLPPPWAMVPNACCGPSPSLLLFTRFPPLAFLARSASTSARLLNTRRPRPSWAGASRGYADVVDPKLAGRYICARWRLSPMPDLTIHLFGSGHPICSIGSRSCSGIVPG